MPDLILTHKPLDILIVSSEYGNRKPTGGSIGKHHGIDFGDSSTYVEGQTPVKASHAGTVIRAGNSSSYGNFVIIQDPISGMATCYTHLHNQKYGNVYKNSSVTPVPVSAGEEIGKIGRTGRPGLETHLHFEVLPIDTANSVRDNTNGLDSNGYLSTTLLGLERVNPRHYLARVFSQDFPTEVLARNWGIDLESDYRNN